MRKRGRYQNWNTSQITFETFEGESQTVPDQTMGLRELITRFTRGQDVRMYEPVYNGEEYLPDIERMDPMERMDFAREIGQDIEAVQLQRQQMEEEAAAREAEEQEPVQEEPKKKTRKRRSKKPDPAIEDADVIEEN